jgi:protein TonB
MISRQSSISIATSMGLHVLLVLLVISGMLEHVHKEIETPPIKIELIPPKKIEPPPPPPPPKPEPKKPEPKKPELPKPPKQEAVKPEPPKVVEPRPEPPKPEPPKPEPAKPAAPAPVAAPTAPEAPPKPAPAPPPETVTKPAPAPAPAGAKNSTGSSAQYVGSCEAHYPNMSKRLNEKGTVVVRVLVKSDGTAGDVELKSSSGYPRLDQAWLETIKNCRFTPSTGNDGKPIDEWFSAPHTFKLN